MTTDQELKELVKEKYGDIALQSMDRSESSCCGENAHSSSKTKTGCCGGEPQTNQSACCAADETAKASGASGCGCSSSDFSIMAEDYSHQPGYVADADLKLGCGIPTEYARMKMGDTVVDLGSGAGNDAFVARSIVGETGRVIGIDMTAPMLEKANKNVKVLGYTNVEFRLGDIEEMPIANNTADVVLSNCVMNLVPNKQKAFAETFRILKSGGHFSISDIVLVGELPEGLRKEAALYAGCVSGAMQREKYLDIIRAAGFVNVVVQKNRLITLPDDLLARYLTVEHLKEFNERKIGIFSINVYADKP